MNDSQDIGEILAVVDENKHTFDLFRDNVEKFFLTHPKLLVPPTAIHSVKSRMKDPGHLRDKIIRKMDPVNPITPTNVFDRITDIAGVRVLHLYQEQFTRIYQVIREQLDRKDWVLYEQPKAYTWDPESSQFFKNHGLYVEVRESFYTSIHFVVKPRPDSVVSCEIQVRTLFEEVWGEIDHMLNYPYSTQSVACREQISVLARLVGAGSRLVDAIFRTHSDEGLK